MARLFVVVDAPQQTAPRGATLLRSAQETVETDERWVAGIRWMPWACGDGLQVGAVPYCGTPGRGMPDPGDWPLGDEQEYQPPFVAVAQQCSTVGGPGELAIVENRARVLLDSCQTVGIARELWRGEVARDPDPAAGDSTDLPNDYLANADTYNDVGDGGSFSLLDGLAALEEGLAGCSCGLGGFIHTTTQVVTYWNYLNLLERLPDGRLITALGTIVVADPGYDGSGQGGAAPDPTGASSWAYATGPISIRLGAVETQGDRSQVARDNTYPVYAFRPFAATFDPCCHIAARLDHTNLT